MPPASLKANLERALAQFDQETITACFSMTLFHRMLFALCFFHSCVVVRHKFGPQGWSRSYGFNIGDLSISASVIRNYLNGMGGDTGGTDGAGDEGPAVVPWSDIRYIVGEVM